ncbi:MAG: hypothetical protein ACKO9A_07780, partial [Alphaproteobacteria bacterium]
SGAGQWRKTERGSCFGSGRHLDPAFRVTMLGAPATRLEAAMASARRVFWACGFQGLAQDLGFHGLPAKQAFQFADPVFKFADSAQGDDLLIDPGGFLPTLGRAAPPLEQQARGDAIKPRNG